MMSNWRSCPLLLLLLAAAAAPTPAAATRAAGCSDVTLAVPGNVILNYDPFDPDRETFDIDLLLRNRGPGPCRVGIALQGQAAGSIRALTGNGRLSYEVQADGLAVPNDLQVPALERVLPGRGDGPTRVRIRFDIPAGLAIGAGRFDDVLTVRLFAREAGQAAQIGQDRFIAVRAIVPARAQVNLAGGDAGAFGDFRINAIGFGQLSQGLQRTAFLQVRATTPVLVAFRSRNDGLLRHATLRHRVPGIRYTLALDGAPIELGAGRSGVLKSPPLGRTGTSYAMTFEIGDVANRRAGHYEDLLTVTVEPR